MTALIATHTHSKKWPVPAMPEIKDAAAFMRGQRDALKGYNAKGLELDYLRGFVAQIEFIAAKRGLK